MQPLWWQLPGPSRFVGQATDQLREANNLVLALPAHLPDGLEGAVRSRFEAAGGPEWVALQVTDAQPASLLFDRFVPATAPGELRNAYTLSRQEDFGGRVIWLRGLTTSNWPKWSEFFIDYAHACRSVEHFHRTVVCAPLSGEAALDTPLEEVCLAVHKWSGAVELLDMQIYAAHLLQPTRIPPLHKLLKGAMLAGLALWDPVVSDLLVEEPLAAIARPQSFLVELANRRGWPIENIDGPRAWALGLSDYIGGREQRHSAALAITDQSREIDRRIWSAEVSVLLPFVEEKRQQIVARLDGSLVGLFRTSDGRETSNLRDLEIGEIEFQLTRTGRPAPLEIRILRRIRNCLAHLEALSVELLESDVLRNSR